jgi:glycylpeptide N-tetradecanoyltransferase
MESSVINSNHNSIRAAYLFYYATSVALKQPDNKALLKERLNALMNDALILAKKFKFDVFNALTVMDNALFLEQQKFAPGDSQLHFYLYNYKARPIAGGIDHNNDVDEEGCSGIGLAML